VERGQRQRIGRVIKLARVERGLTQADLADKMNLSVASISEYERGNRARFTRGTAMAFEEALGISDRRLLVALGYERPLKSTPSQHAVEYDGDELSEAAADEVRRYIAWLQAR
jgi:transcriptional regulator with XRE-family HTH domain